MKATVEKSISAQLL